MHLKYLWGEETIRVIKTWAQKQPWTVIYFHFVCGCMGAQEGKTGFCLWFISPSQVKVRTLHLKEGELERQQLLQILLIFFLSSLLHKNCKNSCLRRNALILMIPPWLCAQPGRPHLNKGEMFFEHKETILPYLKHPPSHQTHQYLYWSPKG